MRVIRENIERIEEAIRAAAIRAGREKDEIRLMAVSKTQDVESIDEAYAAGMRLFGENRVAEAAEKFGGRYPEAELHLIGHIQRNKAKQAVEIARTIQSVDALRTLNALEKHATEFDKQVNILIEVNTSGESSKQGVREEAELRSLIEAAREAPHLVLQGLMTMAPFTDDQTLIRRSFRSLKSWQDRLCREYGADCFSVLSMGMTNDYEIAVEEGSTLLRIGTAIFGSRS